jgi:hypothetical protein
LSADLGSGTLKPSQRTYVPKGHGLRVWFAGTRRSFLPIPVRAQEPARRVWQVALGWAVCRSSSATEIALPASVAAEPRVGSCGDERLSAGLANNLVMVDAAMLPGAGIEHGVDGSQRSRRVRRDTNRDNCRACTFAWVGRSPRSGNALARGGGLALLYDDHDQIRHAVPQIAPSQLTNTSGR